MVNSTETVKVPYTSRQRLFCMTMGMTLGVANSLTLATAASANTAGQPMAWQSHALPSMSSPVNHSAAWTSLAPATHSSTSSSTSAQSAGFQSQAAQNQTAHHVINSLFHTHNGAVAGYLNKSAANDLNLTSANQNFSGGQLANFHEVTIQVGGSKEVVSLGTKLTAAEVVAAEQVLTSGNQTIKLSATGTASGGTISLNNTLLNALDGSVGGAIGSLTIAHGVKVVDTLSVLSLEGNLANYGSILTASSTAGSTDTINAGTIYNAAGGHLGSYTGSAATGLYSADPTLNASTSLTNNGTISSAGNLTINAPLVYNVSTPGSAATISAAQNVNIGTQSLTNSGTIAAAAGNVNIASTAALTVDNSSGVIQAKSGNINFSAVDSDLSVTSGSQSSNGVLDSESVNLKSGSGDIAADLGNTDGVVNASGNNIHIGSDSKNLTLGAIQASADPLIFNAGGDVTIDSSAQFGPTNGADLTIVASRNILAGTGFAGIDTSSTTGNGGNVTLVAGANFTGNATTGITITDSALTGHGSTTGGYIDLTGTTNPATAINTSSTNATAGNAGYVELVSYAGSETNSGTITASGAITAQNTNFINANGNVNVIAGGFNSTTGVAITLTGQINAAAITMGTFTPTAISGGAHFDQNGVPASGITSFSQSGTAVTGDIDMHGSLVTTNDVSLSAGRDVQLYGNFIIATGQAAGAGTLDGVVGRNVTINAGRDAFLGEIDSYGGGGTGSGSFNPSAGGNGGNGGIVTVNAGRDISIAAVNVSGGGGGGGTGASETAAATNGGAGGIAGTVNLTAVGNVQVLTTIYAFDGGAGGKGGTQVGGVGGGGGGGSAIGGGGGGGGGGTGNVATDFGTGGGGGFGDNNLLFTGSGAGGGGSAGQGSTSGGGGGGSYFGGGFGGGGSTFGFNAGGSANQGGAGGPSTTPPPNGGAGATVVTAGGGGGAATVTTSGGTGVAGGGAAIVAGHGSVNITSGGNITSSSTATTLQAVTVETASISINAGGAPTTASSASIISTSGADLTVVSAQAGTAGSITIATANNTDVTNLTNGSINISGKVTGQTIALTTGATATNSITVLAAGEIAGGAATLTTVGGGNIINTAGLIDGASVNFVTTTGNVTANTNVQGLQFAVGGNVSITQGASNVAINTSSGGGTGKTFVISSGGSIDVVGAVTNTGSTINLTTTTAGSNITDSGQSAVTATTVTLTSAGSIGTTLLPFVTVASTDNVSNSTAGSVYLSDQSTGTFTVDAKTNASGTLSVASAAGTFNVVEAPFTTVSLTDSNSAGNVLLNSGNTAAVILGKSGGTFTVNTGGNITANANTADIAGSTVSLTSTNGSIGALTVSTPILVANAGKNVTATDVLAATITGSANASSGTFAVTDSATGKAITLNGGITGSAVNLIASNGSIAITGNSGGSASNISLSGSTGISGTAGATLTGNNITLTSSGGDIGSVGQSVLTAAGNNLTLTATTGAVFVQQNGSVNLTSSAAKSGFTLAVTGDLTNSNALTLTAGNISLSATGNLTLTGAVTGNATVSLSGGTITDNSTIKGSAVNVTSTGNIVQTGGLFNGTTTTSITVAGNAGVISGTPTTISVSTPSLSVTGSGSASVANILSTGTAALALTASNLGAGGTLQLTTNGGATADNTVNVTGAVTGQTINIITSTGKGPDNINISGGGTITGASTLNAHGSITTTTTSNIISGASTSLTAGSAITANTNVAALQANAAGNVAVTQGVNTVSLGASGSTGGTFTLTSAGVINVTGAVATKNAAISISTTASGGLDVGAAAVASVSAGTSTVSIGASNGAISDTNGAVLTGGTVSLTSASDSGSVSAPIVTKAGTLSASTGTTANLYVSDQGTGTFNLNVGTVSSGILSLLSQAATLTVTKAEYATTTITDSVKTGNIVFAAGALVGTGAGAVTVSSGNNIDGTNSTETISGTSISLTSTNGSIGGTKAPNLSSASVSLNASSGSATAIDSVAATTVTGNALNTFSFTDSATSGTGINLSSPITANTIVLTTSGASDIIVSGALGSNTAPSITINSGHDLTLQSAASVQATTVNLTASNNLLVGGSLTGTSITAKATNGSVTISKAVTASGSGNSVTISGGASGTAVVINGAINADTIKINGLNAASDIALNANVGTAASSSVTVTAGHSIIGNSAASLFGQAVALTATSGSIGSTTQSVLTSAGTSLALTATTGSSYIQQTGDITLGDSKVAGTFSFVDAGNLTTGKVTSVNGDVTLSASGALTTGGAISAPGTITLSTTGTGAFDANGSITGGVVNLTAKNDFVQAASTTISGSSVTLQSGTTTINGTIDGVLTNLTTGALTTNSGSTIGGTDTTAATVNVTGLATIGGNFAASNGAVTITASNGYTQNGKLTDAGDTLNITGAISIGGNITDTTLTATGSTVGILSGATVSSGTGTFTAPTFVNAGTVKATTALNINATTSVTNSSGGIIGSTSADNAVNITTASISNSGTISATKNLSLTAAATNLIITGSSASFTTGNAAALSLTANKGAITVGDANSNPFSALTNLNGFSVASSGVFTSPLSGITLVADATGKGGTINISASNIAAFTAPTSAFILSANGTTGVGGTVILNLPGTTSSGITIGSAAGNYNISTTGASGGSVSVTTPGALVVNTANLDIATTGAVNTAGATVVLTGNKSVLIAGALDTHTNLGNYGDITIQTNNTAAFNIDNTNTTTTNGQNGFTTGQGLAGQNVTIIDAGGVTVASNAVLSGSQSVNINGTTLVNNGAINTSTLSINGLGTVTLTTAGTGTISKLTNLTVTSATGGINVTGSLPAGAHDITLTALKGAVNFGKVPNVLNATADSSGNGGIINITAATLVQTGLALNANATAGSNGSGGAININISGASALKIGATKGEIIINAANDGTGTGGSASIATNAALTVDANSLNLGTNIANSTLILDANKGALHISNATKIDHGLASLTLASNSSSAFVLGGASATGNGLANTTTGQALSAGTLTLINNGGSITNGTSKAGLQATNSITIGTKTDIGTKTSALLLAAPILSVNALGSAYLTVNSAATFTTLQTVTALQLTSAAAITLPATVTGKTITLTSTAGGYNAFGTNATNITASVTAGNLAIADTQTALVTVNALNASAGNVTLTTGGALTAAKTINASGTISLTEAGVMTTKGILTAGNDIDLTATGTKGAITAGAAITSANGSIDINNSGIGLITLNGVTTASTDVTINSTAGAVTISKALTATTNIIDIVEVGKVTTKGALTAGTDVTITAGGSKGSISQGANIIASTTGVINLTAAGAGTAGTIVDAANSTYEATAGTINLATAGAAIGTASVGFHTGSASPITVNVTTGSTGAVNILDKDATASGSVTLGTATVGSLKFVATNANTANNGTLTIGSVTAGATAALAPIVITTTEQHLAVSANSTIQTANGNITLQNNHIGSTVADINIGAGSTIHGIAALTTNKTAGNVFIAVGTTVPTASTVAAGVVPTPAPNTQNSSTANLITYATKSNPGGSITTGNGDVFTSLNRNLSFSTGTSTSTPSQITVGANVTIIADPPVLAPSINAVNTSAGMTMTNPTPITTSTSTLTANSQTGSGNNVQASYNSGAANFNLAGLSAINSINALGSLNAFNVASAATNGEARLASQTKTLSGSVSQIGKNAPSANASGNISEKLDNGALLLAAEQDTLVNTAFGDVQVKAGSFALLIASEHGLAVYDLHDQHKGAVTIVNAGGTTVLAPGCSAVVTDSTAHNFGEINPAQFVAYRGLASRDAGNNSSTRIFQAEFEMTSMMRGLKPLGQMAQSDNGKTRKALANMLKTAAILSQLRQGGEQFVYHQAPQVTAYAP